MVAATLRGDALDKNDEFAAQPYEATDPPVAAAEKRRRNKSAMKPWLISAIVIAFVWALVSTLSDDPTPLSSMGNSSYFMGGVTGYVMIITLIVGGILWAAAGRRLAPDNTAAHLGMIAAAVVVGAIPDFALNLWGGTIVSANADVDAIWADYDEDSALYRERAKQAGERFQQSGVMTPTSLARPGGIAAAREAVSGLQREAAESFAGIEAAREDAAERSRARLGEGFGRRRFEEEYSDGLEQSERVERLAAEAHVSMHTQLDILSRMPRSWQSSGDSLEFFNDRDLADFNAEADRQDQIAREIEAISQRQSTVSEPAPSGAQ